MSRVLSALKARLDPFTGALIATVVLAALAPAPSAITGNLDLLVKLMVALLFFLHGARMPRDVMLSAMGQWKLHLLVLAVTFLAFPVLGLLLGMGWKGLGLDPVIYSGFLFLCCLPSTVQSSIAFTSIARGNVPAAMCSASLSNMIGIFVTPLLVGLLLSAHGAVSFGALGSICTMLLLPTALGQILQRWIGAWVRERKRMLSFVDRGAILLMVYSACSAGATSGVWKHLPPAALGEVLAASAVLLGAVMLLTRLAAKWGGFLKEDEIAIVFCGSKKSLVTGIPMATLLFPAAAAGVLVIPLIVFHQMQLIVCGVLARRYAAAWDTEGVEPKPLAAMAR